MRALRSNTEVPQSTSYFPAGRRRAERVSELVQQAQSSNEPAPANIPLTPPSPFLVPQEFAVPELDMAALNQPDQLDIGNQVNDGPNLPAPAEAGAPPIVGADPGGQPAAAAGNGNAANPPNDLVAVLNRLADLQERTAEKSSNPFKFKPSSELTVFSGTGTDRVDVDEFMTIFDLQSKLQKLSDVDKCSALLFATKDTAFEYLQSHLQHVPPPQWAVLRSDFIKYFRSENAGIKYWRRVNSARQAYGQAVENYTFNFLKDLRLLDDVTGIQPEDSVKLLVYQYGLVPEIRALVMVNEPATFLQAEQLALSAQRALGGAERIKSKAHGSPNGGESRGNGKNGSKKGKDRQQTPQGSPPKSRDQSEPKSGGSRSSIICHHCDGPGHIKPKCQFKHMPRDAAIKAARQSPGSPQPRAAVVRVNSVVMGPEVGFGHTGKGA